MDYADAINEVLERARRIKLPGMRTDVVTKARREFAKNGMCDDRFIRPIEEVLKRCLEEWTVGQKRAIWLTTETGADGDFDQYPEFTIDMDLEGELMHHLIEELSCDESGKGNGQHTTGTLRGPSLA